MPSADIRLNLDWMDAEKYLRKGWRCWKERWPRTHWIEMVVADDYRFLLVEDGEHTPWGPDVCDFFARDWCVSRS